MDWNRLVSTASKAIDSGKHIYKLYIAVGGIVFYTGVLCYLFPY